MLVTKRFPQTKVNKLMLLVGPVDWLLPSIVSSTQNPAFLVGVAARLAAFQDVSTCVVHTFELPGTVRVYPVLPSTIVVLIPGTLDISFFVPALLA